MKEYKEVKIEDFINQDELNEMTNKEREIYEKCFLLNKEKLQNLTNAQNIINDLNKLIYCKCGCGGNLIPTADGFSCDICG